MTLNRTLVKKLSSGEIILSNNPANINLAKAILKAAFPSCTLHAEGYSTYYYRNINLIKNWTSRGDTCSMLPDLPIINIDKFILITQPLRKGDTVLTNAFDPIGQEPPFTHEMEEFVQRRGVITGTSKFGYLVHGFYWPKHALQLVSNSEPQSESNSEPYPQFEVGNNYEFKIEGVMPWEKGTLMAIIDDRYKYVVRKNNGNIMAFPDIREIQPKTVKVERWVNVFPSGCISDLIYSTEEKAKENAGIDCKQMKLEGTYER